MALRSHFGSDEGRWWPSVVRFLEIDLGHGWTTGWLDEAHSSFAGISNTHVFVCVRHQHAARIRLPVSDGTDPLLEVALAW